MKKAGAEGREEIKDGVKVGRFVGGRVSVVGNEKHVKGGRQAEEKG